MYILVQPGGEFLVQWAKKMHSKLAAQRELIDLPAMQKFWFVAGHRVDIRSAQDADWIRISGGDRPGGIVVFPFLRKDDTTYIDGSVNLSTDHIQLLKFDSKTSVYRIATLKTKEDFNFLTPWYSSYKPKKVQTAVNTSTSDVGFLSGSRFTKLEPTLSSDMVFWHTAADSKKVRMQMGNDQFIYRQPPHPPEDPPPPSQLTGSLPTVNDTSSTEFGDPVYVTQQGDKKEGRRCSVDVSPDGRKILLGRDVYYNAFGFLEDFYRTTENHLVTVDLGASPQVQSEEIIYDDVVPTSGHLTFGSTGTGSNGTKTFDGEIVYDVSVPFCYGFGEASELIEARINTHATGNRNHLKTTTTTGTTPNTFQTVADSEEFHYTVLADVVLPGNIIYHYTLLESSGSLGTTRFKPEQGDFSGSGQKSAIQEATAFYPLYINLSQGFIFYFTIKNIYAEIVQTVSGVHQPTGNLLFSSNAPSVTTTITFGCLTAEGNEILHIESTTQPSTEDYNEIAEKLIFFVFGSGSGALARFQVGSPQRFWGALSSIPTSAVEYEPGETFDIGEGRVPNVSKRSAFKNQPFVADYDPSGEVPVVATRGQTGHLVGEVWVDMALFWDADPTAINNPFEGVKLNFFLGGDIKTALINYFLKKITPLVELFPEVYTTVFNDLTAGNLDGYIYGLADPRETFLAVSDGKQRAYISQV